MGVVYVSSPDYFIPGGFLRHHCHQDTGLKPPGTLCRLCHYTRHSHPHPILTPPACSSSLPFCHLRMLLKWNDTACNVLPSTMSLRSPHAATTFHCFLRETVFCRLDVPPLFTQCFLSYFTNEAVTIFVLRFHCGD